MTTLTTEQQQVLQKAAKAAYEAYWVAGFIPWDDLGEDAKHLWITTASAALIAAQGPIYQHVVRGSSYELIGEAEGQVAKDHDGTGIVQTMRTVEDGTMITVYRGEGGKLWWRFPDEFHDGRFVKVPDGQS